jgi:hypothetical protein
MKKWLIFGLSILLLSAGVPSYAHVTSDQEVNASITFAKAVE